MPLVLGDRIEDTTTTTGTGTVTLAGSPPALRQAFGDVLADGDTVYYSIELESADEWEEGVGTYDTTGPTLARTTVLASSNAGAVVNFSAGTKKVFCTVPAARTVHGRRTATAIDPADLDPVFLVDPDDVAGNDGDTIQTVASGGTADDFTQATGGSRPTLKKAGNGLDGHNVLRFDGGDSMATTTGGDDLADSWTVIEVRKHSSLTSYQQAVSWGDSGSTGERRSPNFKYSDSSAAGGFVNNEFGFIGELVDVDSGIVLANATWYVLVTTRDHSGDTIAFRVDDTTVAPEDPGTLAAYSSTVIRLGCNPGGSENFVGDLAYAAALPAALTGSQLAGVIAFLKARFPSITPAGGEAQALPVWGGDGNALVNSELFQTADGELVVGDIAPLSQPDTLGTSSYAARFSIIGSILAEAGAAIHGLRNRIADQNVLHLHAMHEDGISAVTFNFPGVAHEEFAALGVMHPNEHPWGGPRGSTFIEATNSIDSGVVGDLRGVQTELGVTSRLKLRLRDDTHAWELYDDSATEPSDGGPTAGLVLATGRPVASVANDGTRDTTITTGATRCGLLVVKDGTTPRAAVWLLVNTTLTAVSVDSGVWSTSQGTASRINVYSNSGQIRLENKTGGALNLTAAYYGA